MFPHWRLCAPKNGTSAVAPLNWANPAYIAYHVSVWAILPFLSRVAVSHQDLIRQCPSALMESDSRDHLSMKSVGKSRAWSLQRRPVSSRESTTQRSAGCENSSAGCCSPGAITHICIAFVSLKKKTKHWHAGSHWPFQEPKFGVPTIYSAYFLGLNFREFSQQNMAKHMVRLRSSNLLDPGDLPLRQWYVQSIIVHTGDFHLKMSYFHYPTLSNIESTLW